MSGADRCDEILRMIDDALAEYELGAARQRHGAPAAADQTAVPPAVFVVS